jgi:hypothetical protein
VHVLHADLFTIVEFYAFRVALLIIFMAGLYRIVREEVRRKQ